MNREARRLFKKKLGKELGPSADRIIKWTQQYEGKDDEKLERLIADEIRGLDFNQLMLLTAYIENRHIKQEKVLCDYWLEDGTFLKIDAVSLSYNWDTSNRSWGKYVRNANFYITMRDLACFTRYSGLNPEVNINGLDAGYEWFNSIYPQTARFTAGVKLTF